MKYDTLKQFLEQDRLAAQRMDEILAGVIAEALAKAHVAQIHDEILIEYPDK